MAHLIKARPIPTPGQTRGHSFQHIPNHSKKPRYFLATRLLNWQSETPDLIHLGELGLPPLRKGGQGVFVMAYQDKHSGIEESQITNLPSLSWRSQNLNVLLILGLHSVLAYLI